MIGAIIELDVATGYGRISAQGGAGDYVLGFEPGRTPLYRTGDLVSFEPRVAGGIKVGVAISIEPRPPSAAGNKI